MRLAQHLIFFSNEFNIFNNTGAQMLDSFYQMTLKLLKSENIKILPSFWNIIMNIITLPY